jgi:TRAP-type mannitol/chloroaromatic compound transport system permease small subunit
MGAIEKIIGVIDRVSEWTGRMVSWLVVVFTFVLGYEVVMRYAFNAPTKWAFDMSYILLKKKHVRIDIFYALFSTRKKALVDMIFDIVFFFPLWGVLLYSLIPYVYISWIMDERSMQGYWMPILYPFKTVMPVGVFLLLIQGVAEFLKSALVLARGGKS